jgi:hypothetical protein
MMVLDMSISPPSTSNIVPLREWSTNLQVAARLANPVALGNRNQVAPTSHGEQTSRPSMQNGGTARNGLQEIGLMSIKNGMLITMANDTILVWDLRTFGYGSYCCRSVHSIPWATGDASFSSGFGFFRLGQLCLLPPHGIKCQQQLC